MLAGEKGKEKTMKSDGNNKVKVALWVRLEAKPGKETDVESFLTNGLSIVQDEPATTTWYALKLGPSTFGIFDTFPDDAGRQAHLTGRVAALLKAESANLFAKPPSIEKVDVIAAKLAERTSSSNLKSNVNTGIIGGLR
jgi:quinol monooxygenase YgiN